MILIGTSAKKQGGKSTMVNCIRETCNMDSVQVMFAEYLKQIVIDLFCPSEWRLTVPDLDPDEVKERMCPCGLTIRQLLQQVGTEHMRGIDSNAWVNAWSALVRKAENEWTQQNDHLSSEDVLVLAPDVRFPNEVVKVHEEGGRVVRLLRAPFASQDQHSSETALDDIEAESIIYWSCHHWDAPTPKHLFDMVLDNRKMDMGEQALATENLLRLWRIK